MGPPQTYICMYDKWRQGRQKSKGGGGWFVWLVEKGKDPRKKKKRYVSNKLCNYICSFVTLYIYICMIRRMRVAQQTNIPRIVIFPFFAFCFLVLVVVEGWMKGGDQLISISIIDTWEGRGDVDFFFSFFLYFLEGGGERKE